MPALNEPPPLLSASGPTTLCSLLITQTCCSLLPLLCWGNPKPSGTVLVLQYCLHCLMIFIPPPPPAVPHAAGAPTTISPGDACLPPAACTSWSCFHPAHRQCHQTYLVMFAELLLHHHCISTATAASSTFHQATRVTALPLVE